MKESWICQLDGDGAGRRREARRRRRERGAPWEGDAVREVTPLGQVIVPVPYSGETVLSALRVAALKQIAKACRDLRRNVNLDDSPDVQAFLEEIEAQLKDLEL